MMTGMHIGVQKVFHLFWMISMISATFCTAQDFRFKRVETNNSSSFRALSVVDNKVAWVSGRNGWVGRTQNGGKSWKFYQVKGFEDKGFRSLYAFDNQHAVIANAGAPANILITTNGGAAWKTVYTNTDTAAFFDGIDFWNNQEGLIYGDAINGRMLLLQTTDGGNTWTEIEDRPVLEDGEVSFAASNTGIRCFDNTKVIIATGGKISRLWLSEDKGTTWRTINPPIIQGETTTGTFSLGVVGKILNIVGGDYKNPPHTVDHNLHSNDFGATWVTPASTTRGYRECVEYISEDTWIAVGPTGTDISFNNGMNWESLSDEEGFHVLRKARKGTLIIMAGDKGQISIVRKSP